MSGFTMRMGMTAVALSCCLALTPLGAQLTDEQPSSASADQGAAAPSNAAENTQATPAEDPGQASADGQASVPARRADGRIMFNFQDASLESVLEYFAQVARLTIINDAKVTGRVNVLNRHPMTVDEALEVLNTILKERDYAAVRQGRTLRIIPLEDAKKATIPVYTGNDPARIAVSDQVITQVIPVRYADANQLKRDLAPLIPAYADLSGNVSTNTLILTDTSANVRRIVEIIRALDTSVSEISSVKVFSLKYANAANAARLITDVFKQDSAGNAQQNRMRNMQRFFQRGPGQQGQQQQEEGNRPEARVVASADDRTNTVVVSAPQDLMPVITQVLADLDANPSQDQAVFTYYLRNAQADNVQNVINSLFGTGGGGTTSGTRGNTSTQRGSSFNSGFGTRSGSSGMSGIGAGTGRATSGRSANTSGARLSASASQTTSDLYGQVFAVADMDTNSLLIMTATTNFDRVKELLKEMDRPVPQVLIKVLLAEVTHSNETDLGVEFSAINLKNSGKTTIFTDFGVASATPGGLMFKLLETDVTMAIAALQSVGKLDVLSRPYILASDNQTASIIVGQRVPFISNSRVTDNGQTINTITYEDIGIILNVTPQINPDGLVIMDVAPEISSVTGETVPISDTAYAPVFAKRSAQTRVTIANGQTIVIGGMMQDQKTKTVSKVPLLGDIPLLGALFQRDKTDVRKTELLIFLTPHVAAEPEMLQDMSKGEASRATVVPDAVAPGVYDQHIEGLKRGEAQADTPRPGSPAERVGPADR